MEKPTATSIMPAPFASRRWMKGPWARALCLLAGGMLSAGAASAKSPDLRFEAVFRPAPPRAHVHAVAEYRSADGEHHLEIWRRGSTLLRRDTDDRLTTVARLRPNDPNFRMDLLDHRRRIHAVLDRDSLLRVGRFIDWNDLAYSLRHPPLSYRLYRAASVPRTVKPVAPCTWYALDEAGHVSRICWSETEALPIVILGPAGNTTFKIKAIDHRAFDDGIFRPDIRGYVRNDAVHDISGD